MGSFCDVTHWIADKDRGPSLQGGGMGGLSGPLNTHFGGTVAFLTAAPAISGCPDSGPVTLGPQATWSLFQKAPRAGAGAPHIPRGSGPSQNLLSSALCPEQGDARARQPAVCKSDSWRCQGFPHSRSRGFGMRKRCLCPRHLPPQQGRTAEVSTGHPGPSVSHPEQATPQTRA